MDIETPIARRFASSLTDLELDGRARIRLESYAAAFLMAEPSLATSPDRRSRLAAAIGELEQAGVIRASRAMERSELPPLPRFVVLRRKVPDAALRKEAAGYPWRPELAWASRLPLRRSEFYALRSVQAFLRDLDATVPTVPIEERSLELFGHEKRLDVLRRNRRLFGLERLSLGLLRAQPFAPPFSYRRVGAGPIALVLENVATFRSVLATLPAQGPVGLVVFGGGSSFAASVCYLAELAAEGPASLVREVRYFGDLDRRGLAIPIAADIAARESGLPSVQPAAGLWKRLLEVGRRSAHPPLDPLSADRLVEWLPPTLRLSAKELLVSGWRLAQEAVGMKQLTSDPTWVSSLRE